MSASTFVHVCQQYSRLLIIARPVAAVTVQCRVVSLQFVLCLFHVRSISLTVVQLGHRKEIRSISFHAGLLSFAWMISSSICLSLGGRSTTDGFISNVYQLLINARTNYVTMDSELRPNCIFGRDYVTSGFESSRMMEKKVRAWAESFRPSPERAESLTLLHV